MLKKLLSGGWASLKYIYHLLLELGANGKLFVAWALQEFAPFLAGYPGIVDAANDYVADPTTPKLFLLAFQIFLAGAAGHRGFKVVFAAWERLQKASKKIKELEKIIPPLKY